MKKKYCLITFLVIALSFAFLNAETIGFENDEGWVQDGGTSLSSYGNHSYSESGVTFLGTNILRNSNGGQDNFPGAIDNYSVRIKNQTGAKLVINVESGGVSSFSFAVRRWDGSPAPVYSVKYSDNGGTDWVELSSIDETLLTTSDWFTYEGAVATDASNIMIEVANISGERIMIDNFTWTGGNVTTPSVIVTAPNGNEVWGVGSTQTISWVTTIFTEDASVDISLTYLDDTDTEQSIAIATTTNVGSFEWEITVAIPDNDAYKMKIVVSEGDNIDTDYSNSEFAIITIPTVSIYDIQFTEDENGDSPYLDQRISTMGVVTAVFYNGFYLQDAEGAWNGVFVNNPAEVSVGDNISLEATVSEFYNKTTLNNVSNIQDSGTDLAIEPTVVTGLEVNSESYEGVLVSVQDVTVTSEANNYGEFTAEDTAGEFMIDDVGDYTYEAMIGDFFASITGVVDYSYGNFKLQPRSDEDFVFGTPPDPITNITAQFNENDEVEVSWLSVNENNISGYNVYRNTTDDSSTAIMINDALVNPVGNDSIYTMIDTNPVEGGNTYYYWIEVVFEDETTELFGSASLYVEIDIDFLVINEIMYNTPGNDNEWIELYNTSDIEFDLNGCYLLDDSDSHEPIVFPEGTIIAAGQYFTIKIDHADGADDFPFVPDFDGGDLWSLGNSSDTVRLFSPSGDLIDSVTYDDGGEWPSSPDGDGPSLELISTDLDNDLAVNWQASYVMGGTPGEPNSTEPDPIETTIYDIQFTEDESGDSPLNGQRVLVSGYPVAHFGNLYFIQSGEGAWNGIALEYDGEEPLATATYIFDAYVSEVYNRTTLINAEIVDEATDEPTIYVNETNIESANSEAYEGVLTKINMVTVTNDSLGYGEWEVGSIDNPENTIVVDNLGDYTYEPENGNLLNYVIGPIEYSYGAYKIAPRDNNDLGIPGVGIAPENLVAEQIDSGISLTWDSLDSEEGFLSYNIYKDDELLASEILENEYVDTAFVPAPDTTTEYYVTAVYTGGESGPSNIATVYIPDTIYAPTNLQISVDNTTAVLTWDMPEGREFVGFNIYLNDELMEQTTEMTYTFENLVSGDYTAGVQSVYSSGNSDIVTIEFTIVVGNNNDSVVLKTVLGNNYPNPFNPVTTIDYSILNDTNVTIEVYNLLGQKIKTLVNTHKAKGNYSVVWNGVDDNNSPVSSGIYFYKMTTDSYQKINKMILLK